MGIDDKWGHVYIDKEGNKLRPKTERPFNWAIHYYHQKTEGHALVKHGPRRRICIKISPFVEFEEANEKKELKDAWETYKNSDHHLNKRIEKSLSSELENMIRYGIKDSEVYY